MTRFYMFMILGAVHVTWAQSSWYNYPNNSTISVTSGGDVGIGTISPADHMHVLFNDTTGAVVGYAVQNLGSSATSYSGMLFYDQNDALGLFQGFNNSTHEYRINNVASNPSGTINFMVGGSSMFYVSGSGIGIGTTSLQNGSLLSVNGIVTAKEIVVTNTNWSDYVFSPAYRPMPLGQLKQYIAAHHHLPGIPPQTKIAQKGINVGEIESNLLAKIEELTLHMIDADERNNRLEQQNRQLQERVARLEAAASSSQKH